MLAQNNNVQIIFLDKFHGDEVTGLFKAALTLISFTTLLSVLVGNVVFPRAARAYKESSQAFHALIDQGIHYILACSLPVAIFYFMYADQIIRLVYGPHYGQSTLYMRILSFLLPFGFLNSILAIAITSADRQSQRTTILALTTVLNIVLGLWLIPFYSAVGASVSLLVTSIMNFLLFLWMARKITGWPYRLQRIFPILVASFSLLIFLAIISLRSLWIALPGAVVVYCLAWVALDSRLRQDIRQLRINELLSASLRKSPVQGKESLKG
jgi:O-antigen/teichoic acid export membrane protein